jgi:sialic acid synthase SpsE
MKKVIVTGSRGLIGAEITKYLIRNSYEVFELDVQLGHEFGLDSTTIAVALGATVIERHITLDHAMRGTDQKSSVEIQGMDKLYKQINSVPKYLGDGVKRVYESERPIREKLRG